MPGSSLYPPFMEPGTGIGNGAAENIQDYYSRSPSESWVRPLMREIMCRVPRPQKHTNLSATRQLSPTG